MTILTHAVIGAAVGTVISSTINNSYDNFFSKFNTKLSGIINYEIKQTNTRRKRGNNR